MKQIPRSTLLLAVLAVLALGALPSAAIAQRERTRFDTTFAFNKDGWVDATAVSGEITVTGWTRPEAKIYATIDRGWIDASFSSNRIRMETRSDRGRQSGARYEIMVPIGTRVQVGNVSGNIRVTGTDGEVEATSISGTVEVLGASDRITLSSVSGKLHAAKLRGRTKLHTTSNSIEAEDITGDVSAGTVSGHITLDGLKSSHVTAETVSGTVRYDGTIDPLGSYEFSSHSGSVHLVVPEGIGAELQLETFSGRISSAFPITLKPGDISLMARRNNKKMEFSIGKGGARITASTFSGNITLDKSGHSNREDNR